MVVQGAPSAGQVGGLLADARRRGPRRRVAGAAGVGGGAEVEDAAVDGGHPVPVPPGMAAIGDGRGQGLAAHGPVNRALPKEKTPPSAAISQYPPAEAAAIR